MAVKLIELGYNTGVTGFSESVAAGDSLVVIIREKDKSSSLSPSIYVGVFPDGSATANVYTTPSPLQKIIANPADITINWDLSSTLNTIVAASTQKSGIFQGPLSAIKITSASGVVIAEGQI
jgi:hypothetical protein